MSIRYTIVGTKLGRLVIGGSDKGLSFLTLPNPNFKTGLDTLEDLVKGGVEDYAAFSDLSLRLQRYFNGERIAFSDRLDLDKATTFERVVWNETRTIPYGEVRTYAWVAKRIKKPRAYHAVGQALGRNLFPIIVPCHRVIASDGSLTGFSGGINLKRYLLDMEGVHVRKLKQ